MAFSVFNNMKINRFNEKNKVLTNIVNAESKNYLKVKTFEKNVGSAVEFALSARINNKQTRQE